MHFINFQNANESTYVTSAEEKEVIYEAQKQIENGEVFSHSDIQKEVAEWLKG